MAYRTQIGYDSPQIGYDLADHLAAVGDTMIRWWWQRRLEYRRLVVEEAGELIAQHGDAAYRAARDCAKQSRGRMARYWTKVAIDVARQTGREIGVDTATRYLNPHSQ